MAFDQPLAADHVDFGDNILISLVTRPILGSLCWILGDNSDNKKSSSSSSKLMTDDDHVALQSGLEAMVLDDHNDDDTEVLRNTSTNSEHSSWNYDDADHHHHLPRMIRSDVSVAEQQPASLLPRRSSFTDLMIENVQENHNEHLQQGKKKMSWSENLVEYMDDEVRLLHCILFVSLSSGYQGARLDGWMRLVGRRPEELTWNYLVARRG